MLGIMPIIVIGADSPAGTAVIGRLESRAGEVRAFVTDPGTGLDLKARPVGRDPLLQPSQAFDHRVIPLNHQQACPVVCWFLPVQFGNLPQHRLQVGDDEARGHGV